MKVGIILISLLLPVISGCARHAGNEDAGNEIIFCENCFNDRCIVCTEQGYSLAGPDSVRICADVYDELAFITDDLAIGRNADEWFLMDKDGRVVEKSIDDQYLMSQACTLYEAFTESNVSIWDEILDSYENLCAECLKGKDANGAVELLTIIEEKSRLVGAKMSDEQRQRFERIEDRYRRLRK